MHFLFNFCGLYLFNRGIEREDLLNDRLVKETIEKSKKEEFEV